MTEFVWDSRPLYVYLQTPKEHYDIIHQRYIDFLSVLNDVNKDPVTVFNPLKEKQKSDLQLIREVSAVLQTKKDEDIRKSKAAAEEEEKKQAEEKSSAEEKAEVVDGEETPAKAEA